MATKALSRQELASLGDAPRRQLLTVARDSIRQGLDSGRALQPDLATAPGMLCRPGASFVTLHQIQGGERVLRGCIGSLEATRPLLQNVAMNAFQAAMHDPRFLPVTREELSTLALEISLLTPLEPIEFDDEQDLLRQIEPGQDGLLLQCGGQRGTFLPSVWDQLPEVAQFWMQLKRKAGLATDFWSDAVHCWRYRTIRISDGEPDESRHGRADTRTE